jgi:hypothetical protein
VALDAHRGIQREAPAPSSSSCLERIRDDFADQCAIPISAGSLFNFNQEAFGLLETFESIVRRQLMVQTLLHADETGINVNGTCLWLHCASNDLWTLFFPHPNRGGEAMKAMGVLPSVFPGRPNLLSRAQLPFDLQEAQPPTNRCAANVILRPPPGFHQTTGMRAE